MRQEATRPLIIAAPLPNPIAAQILFGSRLPNVTENEAVDQPSTLKRENS